MYQSQYPKILMQCRMKQSSYLMKAQPMGHQTEKR
jgi:hypothetical protein